MRHRQKVRQTLLASPFSGAELLDLLAQDSEIEKLFAADSGVAEGYSVRQHTERVYHVFYQQLPYFAGEFAALPGIDGVGLLKFVLALHDIGKPLAIRAEGKHAQHDYTLPILVNQMERFGFARSEIQLACALIGHDEVGRFLKGKTQLEECATGILRYGLRSGIGIADFFALQTFYYTVDAGSYRFLRQRVFTEEEGPLRPRDPRFSELRQKVLSYQV